MESGRTRESIIACTIKHLMESGTVTYETSGWGTGEISIKCRSNIKCAEDSMIKELVALKASESEVSRENVDEYVVKALEKKLTDNEIHILTVKEKKYSRAKRKFQLWKNMYKKKQS
ncbi:MAG: hypothetical protein K2N73_00840 [Lachnospiraceae bacterium]|nr:hypothetical protein [Lachnospiraceae bacterium]